jgi:LPXTG-motif cell wall-anchored protein
MPPDPCIDSDGDGKKTPDKDGDGIEDDPTAESCELPVTGMDIGVMAAIATMLAVLGGATLYATRKQHGTIR